MSQIKTLIAQGKLKQALDLLPDTTEFISLKARFNRLESKERMGTISESEANLESNRITHALLQTLGDETEPIVQPPPQPPTPTQQAITLATRQEFSRLFALLDPLNLQEPLYYQLKTEFTNGIYRYDPQYTNRLTTFLNNLQR